MYQERIIEDDQIERMSYRIPSIKAYHGLKRVMDNAGAI